MGHLTLRDFAIQLKQWKIHVEIPREYATVDHLVVNADSTFKAITLGQLCERFGFTMSIGAGSNVFVEDPKKT